VGFVDETETKAITYREINGTFLDIFWGGSWKLAKLLVCVSRNLQPVSKRCFYT